MFTTAIRTLVNVPVRRLTAAQSISMRCASTSTMHENDPEVLEREKRRNLKREIIDLTSTPHDNAPGWNEALASASEAIVKAEKSTADPQTLQTVTVNYFKKGRLDTEGEASTTAYYSKDEVTGPLRNAPGKNGKDDLVVKHGEVLVDEEGPDSTQKSLKEDETMTASEEDVKAEKNQA